MPAVVWDARIDPSRDAVVEKLEVKGACGREQDRPSERTGQDRGYQVNDSRTLTRNRK